MSEKRKLTIGDGIPCESTGSRSHTLDFTPRLRVKRASFCTLTGAGLISSANELNRENDYDLAYAHSYTFLQEKF